MSITLRDRGLQQIFSKAIDDGRISSAELDRLKKSAEDGSGISKTERADLERLLARHDLFEPGVADDLRGFLGLPASGADLPITFKDVGIRAAAQQLSLQDGISLAEVEALLAAAADGTGLSQTERTDLTRLLVRSAGLFAADARAALQQALGIPVDGASPPAPPDAPPDVDPGPTPGPVSIPDPFPDVVFDEQAKVQQLDSLFQKGAQRALYDALGGQVTTWSNPKGPRMYFGDGWVAQRYDLTATHRSTEGLVMVHPGSGDTRNITGSMVGQLLARSAEHGGRTKLEVMGNPRSRSASYGRFVFDHGETYDGSRGWGAKVTVKTDAATRNQQLDQLPKTTMTAAEAAVVLKGAFGTVARAVDDVKSEPAITRADLELVALESDAPAELKAAARSVLGQGLFEQIDVAAGKRFPDDRITLDALDAVIDPDQVPPRTRPLADPSLYALDYIDTSGPDARVLGRDRKLSVTVWAAPGAVVNVYDRMVPDGGEPKKIFSQTVDVNTPGANGQGLVKVTLNIPKDADWQMGDKLALTQQMGTRAESSPIQIDVRGKGGAGGREAMLEAQQVTVSDDGWVRSMADFTARPYARLQLLKNGVDTGVVVQADAYGRFEAKLPGELTDGTWELRAGWGNGVKRVPLGTDRLVDARQRVQGWLTSVRTAMMQEPTGSHLRTTLRGVEPGWSVKVNNPGAGGGPQTFTADASGNLAIDVGNVAVGDTLQVTFGELRLADFWLRETTYTLTVPTAQEAQRIHDVFAAIGPKNERDAFFALDLFGPYSTMDAFKDVTDPARMQLLFVGARMGAYLEGQRLTDWMGPVEQQLERAGKTVELEGLRAAKAYRGKHSPRTGDDVGIKLTQRGASHTVVVGGYNMLHPERSSPLRPETRTDPSTYELSWLGLDKLTLRSRGTSPQGWVNPNAYLFTFTRG